MYAHHSDRCGGCQRSVILGEGQLQHERCCCPCAIPEMKQEGHSGMHQTFIEAAKRRERDTASGACFSRVLAAKRWEWDTASGACFSRVSSTAETLGVSHGFWQWEANQTGGEAGQDLLTTPWWLLQHKATLSTGSRVAASGGWGLSWQQLRPGRRKVLAALNS